MLFVVVMQIGLHWLQAHLHSRALAGFVYILLWYSATISVAVLSYKYFEAPFLRLKERLAPSHQAPATSFTGRGSGVCEA
jgi:peptidoglycan/LPS O-acetylase OafA/YrhL